MNKQYDPDNLKLRRNWHWTNRYWKRVPKSRSRTYFWYWLATTGTKRFWTICNSGNRRSFYLQIYYLRHGYHRLLL